MTLQEFTRDIVPIFMLFVTSLGLISLILMWWQIRKGIAWNKLSATRDHFNDLPSQEDEIALQSKLRSIGIDPYTPLTEEQASKVFHDPELFLTLKLYLNKYEVYCAALAAGMVDEEYARTLAGDKVVVLMDVFEKLIHRQRKELKLDVIWIEIERLAAEWKLNRDAESQRALEATQKMLSELHKMKSVKSKY
jgi:hypothetical protein